MSHNSLGWGRSLCPVKSEFGRRPVGSGSRGDLASLALIQSDEPLLFRKDRRPAVAEIVHKVLPIGVDLGARGVLAWPGHLGCSSLQSVIKTFFKLKGVLGKAEAYFGSTQGLKSGEHCFRLGGGDGLQLVVGTWAWIFQVWIIED